jgi:tRNA pseudouridine38-40 synthase
VANIKLVLEYDGSRFHGWQAQPAPIRTVETTLRGAIEDLTGEVPQLIAAGRTDAGVHALGQCVNFRLVRPFAVERLAPALNVRLSPDIAVRSAELVADDFHARYSASLRRYAYRIRQVRARGAYERQYAWSVIGSLDLPAMSAAASRLVGRHDFGAFGRSPRPGGHTFRQVHQALVTAQGDWVTLLVAANAFLYGMMRAFAYALVEVGLRRRQAQWIDDLLNGTRSGLRPAPAQGLVQVSVEY